MLQRVLINESSRAVRPTVLILFLLLIVAGCSEDRILPTGIDSAPPSRVGDLQASAVDGGSVTLVWTAPVDRGPISRPQLYDVRYSTSEIDESNWESANQCLAEPAPGSRGTQESFVVAGLLSNVRYYFALRTADRFHNWSDISNTATAVTESRVIWSYQTGGWVRSSPAINAGGLIVVKDDYRILVFRPDGDLVWHEYVGGDVYTSPAAPGIDTVYVGSRSGRMRAVRLLGGSGWYYETGGAIRSSPAIGKTGTVYVGSADGRLHAITPYGTSLWYVATGDWVQSSPAIGRDGTVYVGSGDGKLYAIGRDGVPKWTYDTGRWIRSSPAIGPDESIYVGSDNGKLYAIGSDGSLSWTYQIGSEIESSPALAMDGTIYVGSDDGRLYAIHPDGTLRWFYQTGYKVTSSPAVASDGTIYVGSDDGNLYAIRADGSLAWSQNTGGAVISSPTIDTDGTLYVGSDSGLLLALSGDSPPADSSWPMFRQNPMHTGRVVIP